MSLEALFIALLVLARIESPTLDEAKHPKYFDSLRVMSALYVEVGKEGALVSNVADPLILAAIGYEESRHRTYVEDGDCRQTFGMTKAVCFSVGPMQLSRATPRWWPSIVPGESLSVEDLRDPSRSVSATYKLLQYWRDKCGGDVAKWLGSWSAGKCTRYTIGLGRRRAALAGAIGHTMGLDVPALPFANVKLDAQTRRKVDALLTKQR